MFKHSKLTHKTSPETGGKKNVSVVVRTPRHRAFEQTGIAWKRSWTMLHSQPIQNDQCKSLIWFHRQNKQLPLATGCQEQLQNGRVCAPTWECRSRCWWGCPSPSLGAAAPDAAPGCSHSSLLPLTPLASPSSRGTNHLYPHYKAVCSLFWRKKNAMHSNLYFLKKKKKKGPPHEIKKKSPSPGINIYQ